MSAAMDSSTSTIYVELLDEGTFVLRPTHGRRLSGNRFELLATPDYDPELETWRFAPGSTVECDWEEHGGERLVVAKRLVP
jgi:hypothetical protein